MVEKIEVWGDSILKGVVLDSVTGRYCRLKENCCVARVQRNLHIPIENHAHFGMTSEKGRALMARALVKASEKAAALIGFGGNDIDYDWQAVAKAPAKQHQPHTTAVRFAENMAQMIRLAQDKDLIPVLMTLPPIDARRYYKWISRDIREKENILLWLGDVEQIYRSHAAYNDIICALAKQTGCRLIDLRAAFLAQGDYRPYLCLDGIHPNADGHVLMERAFLAYVRCNTQPA